MIFEKLEWQNLFSYGNVTSELSLNNRELNLITGKNGHGKSAAKTAFLYAVTGKADRKIKKAQLVNKDNKKNLVTKVTGTHNGSIYTIERGVKPDIFNIYKDDVLIHQDSHVKDYQSVIDTLIGLDEKSLKQTAILSSREYTPFLDMAAAEKRAFIENLLSIQVFSSMLDAIKKRISTIKSEIRDLEKDKERYQSNIETIQEMLKDDDGVSIETLQEQLKETAEKRSELQKKIEEFGAVINSLSEKSRLMTERVSKEVERVNKIEINAKIQIEQLNEHIKFFDSGMACNQCGSDITEETKQQQIQKAKDLISEYERSLFSLEERRINIDLVRNKITNTNEKESAAARKQAELCNESESLRFTENTTRKDIERKQQKQQQVDGKIASLEKQIKEADSTQKAAEEKKRLHELATEVISDKGIKRYILNKYVPVLNNLVNEFLQLMDAEYGIEFDMELNETIVARGYDSLSYGNFSAGEKQRVDLALLFAFLEIGRMRNTVNCNLLMLDEVLDTSLDEEGIRGVMRILERFKRNGTTVYVISHREGIDKYFDNVYSVTKKQFSEITKL